LITRRRRGAAGQRGGDKITTKEGQRRAKTSPPDTLGKSSRNAEHKWKTEISERSKKTTHFVKKGEEEEMELKREGGPDQSPF